MVRVLMAAAVFSMIAGGAVQAAGQHHRRGPADVHDNWRARNNHGGRGQRGASSYGGNIWVGSSYEPPRRSGHRKGL